jgi:RND family efflux transporter MFP subunit
MRDLVAGLVLALGAGGAVAQAQPVEADCVIRPSQILRLGAPVSGIIAEVTVERGDRVAAGDVLARLDTSVQEMAIRSARARAESRADLAAAQARADLLVAQLDRQKALLARNVVSAATVEETETALLVARNDVQSAQQDIALAEVDLAVAEAERARRTIRSPIDGFVLARDLSAGEYWAEGAPLATIADVAQLHVEAVVDIAAFGRIAAGDIALVLPEAPVGGSHPAAVTVIDPVFDAASGTFGVRLLLDNATAGVPAGLRCRVVFGGA